MLPPDKGSTGHVTIGVPVYQGERWLEETLRSIQQQTHRDFDVLMSIDGPDPVCEAICERFVNDSRFRLVVQPRRLGWTGNVNWLMKQASGDYWYFHQQDDLTAENYLEALLDHARRNPAAALVCCELVPFGRIEGRFPQPASVMGPSPFVRLMTFLNGQFAAFAFRGLTRVDAVRRAGDVPSNEFVSFGGDICWVAAVALTGEVHHLPLPLYRKRYHDRNTESSFWAMPREARLEAWAVHCAQMLEPALRVEGTVEQARLLWLAAVERLTSSRSASGYLPVADLSHAERRSLLDRFMRCAASMTTHDVPVTLDAGWPEIRAFTEGYWRIPTKSRVDIVAFGPSPVRSGEPFQSQPDGNSALWVRTAQRPAPNWALRLGGTVLDTVMSNSILTGTVPPHLTRGAGDLELVVVGPDGEPRSEPVLFRVLEQAR
jgi:GT2 family glycosyltransferase